MTRVLVVDNHDSFVHTLVGYLRELGADTTLVESDATDPAEIDALLGAHDALLLSPGPGAPVDAGVSVDAARIAMRRGVPTLGVCLGHQVIGAAFGTAVGSAPEVMHGMVSAVRHDGSELFAGLPSPFDVGRYHSLALAAGDLPADLIVTATAPDGTVMALAHRTLPVHGVQFHPESVLTPGGYRLLANWLRLCGDEEAVTRSVRLDPLAR
ncbi:MULTISPECIES: aminodeoxychorismate/anthranilate synthase component II [unclassified Microbacterium]|uniref:anthranilate synthase component II n=1 Tax=unclassified Microbacterium TaxID=2609290 RepID=UPI0024689B50|nr:MULTISPECIES: aminodeoxychorismate/anthranilate synthase component II [unclassified Microbacterium]MDH5132918.1 aminodeoxychorismate/anthranilate synthase component II [Microbacterium sp. RD10]MDH5136040.1 aminodeoxychorismate/anthranilate synthase component II [Microbacterium sp. RD11]MDH5154444.1 aminodeoxychorismate/anthranilate synthase component II [Microbacterium sp. RD06]MDH5167120.1 aminodeoxychorismate/anthranilate synthase component II [Microbacterium sp. RD02]